jgi:hypothetical protein
MKSYKGIRVQVQVLLYFLLFWQGRIERNRNENPKKEFGSRTK